MTAASPIACVYAVFADSGEAKRIGRLMVEEGLAGCVNILPACLSLYRWDGAIESAAEVPALFKTSAARAEALAARIAELHSYQVPAVSHWPAATTPDYAAWLHGATP